MEIDFRGSLTDLHHSFGGGFRGWQTFSNAVIDSFASPVLPVLFYVFDTYPWTLRPTSRVAFLTYFDARIDHEQKH